MTASDRKLDARQRAPQGWSKRDFVCGINAPVAAVGRINEFGEVAERLTASDRKLDARQRAPQGWSKRDFVCGINAPVAAVGRINEFGEVAERLNAPVLKTGKVAIPSGVRIPPSPPS